MPMFTVLRRFAVPVTMLLERILLHVTPSTTVQVILLVTAMCVPSDMPGYHTMTNVNEDVLYFDTCVVISVW